MYHSSPQLVEAMTLQDLEGKCEQRIPPIQDVAHLFSRPVLCSHEGPSTRVTGPPGNGIRTISFAKKLKWNQHSLVDRASIAMAKDV